MNPYLAQFHSTIVASKKGSVTLLDYKLIEKATDNFRDSNILGEGGFGRVYKAQLDDNLIVAVKRLDCANQEAEKEFQVIILGPKIIIIVIINFFMLLNCESCGLAE